MIRVTLILSLFFVAIWSVHAQMLDEVSRTLGALNGNSCIKEPKYCSDPVTAICDDPISTAEKNEIRPHSLNDAIKSLPGAMSKPDFIFKHVRNQSELRAKLLAELSKKFEFVKSMKNDEVEEKILVEMIAKDDSPKAKALAAQYRQNREEIEGFYRLLDQRLRDGLKSKGIELEKNFYEPLQKRLMDYFGSKAVLQSNSQTGSIGPADLTKTVASLKLLNGHLDEAFQKNDELWKWVYDSCGQDSVNAFMTNEHQQGNFLICPGALATLLDGHSPEELLWIGAHELAHSVDSNSAFISFRMDLEKLSLAGLVSGMLDDDEYAAAEKQYGQWNDKMFLDERYEPFLACMREHAFPEAATYAKLPDYLKDEVLPEIERLARVRAGKNYSAKERAEILKYLNELKAKYEIPQTYCDSLKGREDLNPTRNRTPVCEKDPPFRGFDHELVADHYANEWLISHLPDIPAERRFSTLRQVYRDYCGNQVSMDLVHPPRKARISPIFNHPEVRRLLGCTSPARSPYCDFAAPPPNQ